MFQLDAHRLAFFPLVLAVAVSSIGCRMEVNSPPGAESKKPASPAAVGVAIVIESELPNAIEIPGTFAGIQQVKLLPRVEGYVQKVHVDIGDEVAAGQLLAELNAPELLAVVSRREQLVAKAAAESNSKQAEITQARAQLSEQHALKLLRLSELKRTQELVRGGAFNKQKLDEAQFAYEAVDAAIQRSQADVVAAQAKAKAAEADQAVALAELYESKVVANFLEIKAPFDGLIVSRMVDAGQFVEPAGSTNATPLLEVADMHKVRVIIFVPMDDAIFLNDGDEVKIHEIQGLPGEQVPGVITRNAKSYQQGSRMMRAEIELENPKDANGLRRLKTGDYGKVALTLASYRGLIAPLAALGGTADERFVIVLTPENKCSRRSVEVQYEGKSACCFSGNVQAGDRVIVGELGNYKDEQQLTGIRVDLKTTTVK